MKNFLLPFLLLVVQITLADSLDVSGYKQIPSDISATRYPRHDANDRTCALLKVNTDLENLGFETNMKIVGNIEKKAGEYWIYVSPGERRLSIFGAGLIRYNFDFPDSPKEGKVYQLIITRKGAGGVTGASTGFVVLKSLPPGTKVWIDEEYMGLTPFQREMAVGFYNFRLEKEMYYTKQGSFTVKINETEKQELTLDPNFGSLKITSAPVSGASITLDGTPTKFKTPCTFDTLTSGQHTVALTLDLYEPVNRTVTIRDTETAILDIPLNAVFGNVKINTSPESDIYIDAEMKSRGTWEGILTRGMHTIEAKKDKHYPQTQKFDMKAGAAETLTFTLKPIMGSLSIVTEPPEAEIFIGGQSYGETPKIIPELIIGTYEITLKKDGFSTLKTSAEVKENQRTSVNHDLKNFREITIKSNPSGANLLLNGKSEGVTPKTLTTQFGKNTLVLSKSGYNDFQETFTVTEQQETYTFNLVSNQKALAQMDFRKYKTRKNWWLGGTLATAAAGGYFYFSSEKHYDEYQSATSDASDLHNQIKTEDILWPTFFGISGVCAVVTIINASKQGKAKKKINLSAVPFDSGGLLSIQMNF